jgi:osmotically-inducible protein OsmY
MTIQDLHPTSDDRLRAAILEALSANARTASLELRVGVSNGIVHLAGHATSLEIWKLVETVVARTPGVRGVVNRIEAPGAPSPARTIHLDIQSETSPDSGCEE